MYCPFIAERSIEVILLIFGDVRDVPFCLYSCENCIDIIREKLIVKQERLQKWIEEDHAKRMKEKSDLVLYK